MIKRLQALTFQRSINRFTGHLLPPGTGLFISHDEVLIIDAGQMKMQHASIYYRLPHQTGVTERSICRHDWLAANRVLHQVVVSHQAHRISDCFPVILDRQDHVLISDV